MKKFVFRVLYLDHVVYSSEVADFDEMIMQFIEVVTEIYEFDEKFGIFFTDYLSYVIEEVK